MTKYVWLIMARISSVTTLCCSNLICYILRLQIFLLSGTLLVLFVILCKTAVSVGLWLPITYWLICFCCNKTFIME